MKVKQTLPIGHQEGLVRRDDEQTHGYTQFTLAERAAELARLNWATQGLDLRHLREAVQLASGPRGRTRAADLRGGHLGDAPAAAVVV